MPKLRNATTDIGMFTQWMARKCRNHNPLSELGLNATQRTKTPNMYKNAPSKEVFMVDDGAEDKMVYMAAGRAFQVTVTELAPDQAEALPKAVVSH